MLLTRLMARSSSRRARCRQSRRTSRWSTGRNPCRTGCGNRASDSAAWTCASVMPCSIRSCTRSRMMVIASRYSSRSSLSYTWPWPGHEERAIGIPQQRHVVDAQIHQAVQRVELALQRTAARDVDERKARRVDDVPGRNHVAAAEEHDDVAVGVRIGRVDDLNAFAVQIHRVQAVEERLRRLKDRRDRRVRRGHPREHVLVREHARVAEIREHVVAEARPGRDGARQNAQARFRKHLVAADVVGVHARVDDVADRQRRELAIAASTSSAIAVEPESTRMTPSGPICTTMLPPAPPMT